MISAVVVAYRTPSHVSAAVASLRAQTEPPAEIVVIDNGSADGHPLPDGIDARVERPPANLGFGRGCNLGVARTSGDEILILNGDVVLTQRALGRLRARLATDPRIAIVGPRIISGGDVQLSARGFPSPVTGLLGRSSPLTRLLVRAGWFPAEFRPAQGTGGFVDWVTGACLLVRREAFDAVGGFDPAYWMYWEDADLCRRLLDDGWRVYFEPAAVVHHATQASGTSERTVRAFHASAALFAERHISRRPLHRRLVWMLLRLRESVLLRFTAGDRAT